MEDTGLILSGKEWIKRKRKEFGKLAAKAKFGTVYRDRNKPASSVVGLSKLISIQEVIESLAKMKRDPVFMLEAGLDAINEVDSMIIQLNKEQLGISLFYYDKVGVL